MLAKFLRSINPIYQWNIHSTNYELKSKIRKAIFNSPLLSRFIRYDSYRSPQAGYEGWYDFPGYGCLAFKPDNGEPLFFSW